MIIIPFILRPKRRKSIFTVAKLDAAGWHFFASYIISVISAHILMITQF